MDRIGMIRTVKQGYLPGSRDSTHRLNSVGRIAKELSKNAGKNQSSSRRVVIFGNVLYARNNRGAHLCSGKEDSQKQQRLCLHRAFAERNAKFANQDQVPVPV